MKLWSLAVATALMSVTPVTGWHIPVPSGPQRANVTSASTHANGVLISKTLVHIPSGAYENPRILVYKVFYWSDGVKVEAFVTVPRASGTYPVVLSLHGGFFYTNHPLKHVYADAISTSALGFVSSKVVEIFPQYRGYAESGGYVGYLDQDVADTRNALQMLRDFPQARINDLYVTSVSLGGGVGLMLASELHSVRAVVAVSPFCGYDLFVYWGFRLPSAFGFEAGEIMERFGSIPDFAHPPRIYQEQSPYDHTTTISAPVLLLQGTNDPHVPWQSVQSFYERMKREHKTVQLDLFPGGHHGLLHRYLADKLYDSQTWLTQYGCPPIFDSQWEQSIQSAYFGGYTL